MFKDVTDPIDVIWPCLNHVGSMFSYDLHGRRSRRSCPQRRTPACRTPFWWDAHTVGFQPFRRAHCMLGLVICFDDYRLVFQVCLDTSVVWLTLFSIDFKSGPCCPLCSAFICAFQLECFSCFFCILNSCLFYVFSCFGLSPVLGGYTGLGITRALCYTQLTCSKCFPWYHFVHPRSLCTRSESHTRVRKGNKNVSQTS